MDAYRRQRWTVNGVLSNAKSNLGSSKPFHDRFIVPMDALDVEVARHLLHEDKKEDESPTKKAYGKVLASCLFNDAGISTRRGRIMNHHTKRKAPPKLKDLEPGVLCEVAVDAKLKGFGRTKRYIPQTADRTLDAPDILDDYYLNLLDWSSTNIVSIALGDTAYMWNATMKTSYELFSVDEDVGPITSVNWAPNGIHLAAGMNNSVIQLWDHDKQIQLRNLNGHTGRVGALSWNGNIVTAGSLDGKILSHDVRVRDSIVQMFRGHREEVCGLKWSLTGKLLASGGNDNLLHIWEKRMASSSSTITTPYLHRFTEHRAAVKAQAWCPFQNHVLASGGGSADRCIKLWNVNSGQCLNSIDTNSQVCALLWNKHEKELLSSHGYADNQLTLWKYPSMTKITELSGHSARVLHMAQSPDGCTVASAGADETLRFWQIFRDPVTEKKKRTTEDPPFRKTGRIFLR